MNPLTNVSAKFKEELREIINRYGVDSRVGIPDFILAEYCISCLVSAHELKKEENRYYNQEVKSSDLIPSAKPSFDRYLIFAKDRSHGVDWAVKNEIPSTKWIVPDGPKTIAFLLASETHRKFVYKVVKLDGWDSDPNLKQTYEELVHSPLQVDET